MNTGTEAEFISLRIERLSQGPGRGVPPSWIQATGPRVRLAPRQATRIPLELTVPTGAKPGRYLSDIVVSGSTAISAGQANFGAAAATTLEFRVAPGAAPGPWPPTWVWWTMGGLLLLALASYGVRRSGLRIRIERRPPPAAHAVSLRAAATQRTRWRSGSRAVLALVTVAGLAACGQGNSAAARGQGASITISLKVVPTVRSVSVSPSKEAFGSCGGGNANNNTASTADALGYPNGQCWVGQPAGANTTGSFPITITNMGIASYIYVNGANAVPSDAGTQWSLCNFGSTPAVGCNGDNGLPGMDQYVVENFAPGGKTNTSGLTGKLTCDDDFGTSGGCRTEQGDGQREGIELIGPARPDDPSTSWTVTITWTAVPPGY